MSPRLPRWLAIALVAAFGVAGCGSRYTPRHPAVFRVEPIAQGGEAPAACVPDPAREAPRGETPPPTASGALSLLDVVGDDRLGVAEAFAAAFSPDGERLYMATADRLLAWHTATGALERAVAFETPFDRPSAIVVSADGAWLAAQGTGRPVGDHAPPPPSAWLVRTEDLQVLKHVSPAAGELGFTPDATELFSESGLHVTLATLAERRDPPADVEARYLPDGARYVAFVPRGDDAARRYVPEIRDAATGRMRHRLPDVAFPHAVAISGDGSRIAVLDEEAQRLTVFETGSFERVAAIEEIGDARMVSLSPDGKLAVLETLVCVTLLAETFEADVRGAHGADGDERASAGARARGDRDGCPDPLLSLWDVDGGVLRWSSPAHAGERWVFSADGAWLSGPPTRLVETLLRVRDGSPAVTGGRIRAISPDGRFALRADRARHVIEAIDGEAPFTPAPASRLVALSHDGGTRLEVDDDNALRLARDGACIVVGAARDAATEAWFSRDDRFVVLVGHGEHGRPIVRGLDARTGATSYALGIVGEGASAVRVRVAGDQVLVQGNDHDDVQRFDARTGAALPDGHAPRLRWHTPSGGGGYTYEVRDTGGDRVSHLNRAALLRDGTTLFTFEDFDRGFQLSVWDLAHPERVVDQPAEGWPVDVVLAPDESTVAVTYRDGHVCFFGRDDHARIAPDARHEGAVTALVYTPDGGAAVSAGEDGTLLLLSTTTGALLGRAELPLDHATHLAISASGRELVAETARGQRVRFALSSAP